MRLAAPIWTLLCALAILVAQAAPSRAEMFGPIAGNVYGSGQDALVLVLHGDRSSGYITDFALDVARNNPQATVIHMARPGYSLRGGQYSKGSNNGRRDHHTKHNNMLLAEGIAAAKQRFPNRKLIAFGHSGGGNQIGVVVGRNPGLIDTAIMMSTQLDVGRWRSYRGQSWGKSESLVKFLPKVPRGTRLIAATGDGDSNTVPSLARSYVKKAQSLGLNATFIEIPNANHGFKTLHQPALVLVTQEIRQ